MDPIERLIAANPTPAIVHVPETLTAYDPDQTYFDDPTETPEEAVDCLFYKATEEGLETDMAAWATFRVDDVPGEIDPETWSVTVAGTHYTIASVRKRFRRGGQSGWTLGLRE